jgi:hypothetical protein
MSVTAQFVFEFRGNVYRPLERTFMVDLEKGAWRNIAERASTEMDPGKLNGLVDDLNKEFEREDEKRSPSPTREPADPAA